MARPNLGTTRARRADPTLSPGRPCRALDTAHLPPLIVILYIVKCNKIYLLYISYASLIKFVLFTFHTS